jgi:hypothetical protein
MNQSSNSQPCNEASLYNISSARFFFAVLSVKKVHFETIVESSLILLMNRNVCKARSARHSQCEDVRYLAGKVFGSYHLKPQ